MPVYCEICGKSNPPWGHSCPPKTIARKEREYREHEEDDASVFTNCNVCGIKLRTEDEDKMGMCERCADEEVTPNEAIHEQVKRTNRSGR